MIWKMSASCFRFKSFTIYRNRCSMKEGTDGVLLGGMDFGRSKQKHIGL